MNEKKAREMIDRLGLVCALRGMILVSNRGALRDGDVEFIRDNKADFIDLIRAVQQERKETEKAAIRAGVVEYLVCDASDYGIHNGFSDADKAFQLAADDALDALADKIGLGHDYVRRIDSSRIARYLRPYQLTGDPRAVPVDLKKWYRPCPISDGFTDEYKALCREEIERGCYIGYCDVPFPAAVDMVMSVAEPYLAELLECEISGMHYVLEQSSGYVVETTEDARDAEKRYNDLQNEGGDGYVPHWYTVAEVEQYKQKLAGIEAALAKLRSSAE